jgi:ligand-binding SRPBCC domain-containing protein
MKTYYFKTEQVLPVSIEKAWEFFSSARNLALITPPDLGFKIVTIPREKEIYEGMIIEYKVKPLLGIPVRWKTEICRVDKPRTFTDQQLAGPYKTWIHTHTFVKKGNDILMTDEVRYALPYGWIGSLGHSLVVRKKIKKIFDYRRQVLHKIFVRNEHSLC